MYGHMTCSHDHAEKGYSMINAFEEYRLVSICLRIMCWELSYNYSLSLSYNYFTDCYYNLPSKRHQLMFLELQVDLLLEFGTKC